MYMYIYHSFQSHLPFTLSLQDAPLSSFLPPSLSFCLSCFLVSLYFLSVSLSLWPSLLFLFFLSLSSFSLSLSFSLFLYFFSLSLYFSLLHTHISIHTPALPLTLCTFVAHPSPCTLVRLCTCLGPPTRPMLYVIICYVFHYCHTHTHIHTHANTYKYSGAGLDSASGHVADVLLPAPFDGLHISPRWHSCLHLHA